MLKQAWSVQSITRWRRNSGFRPWVCCVVLLFVSGTGCLLGPHDLDCNNLTICHEDGLCKREGYQCVATNDSCKKSLACRNQSMCSAHEGVCIKTCVPGSIICKENYKFTCHTNTKVWVLEECGPDGCNCTEIE